LILQGDEVTFLPPIVDAAESSPAAAAEAARLIRKYMHRDYWTKPSYQYNSIMLMRILADNPGPAFTRSMDKKFLDVTKELLRGGRDPSVRHILMETLDAFETQKCHDENLGPLIEMWKKEKEKAYKAYGVGCQTYELEPQHKVLTNNMQGRPPPPVAGPPQPYNVPSVDPHSQNYFSRSHHNKRLPNPVELANRLEEARTSSKLLEQVVACTPPSEILSNDLIKEFADRCLSASRSLQGYMSSTDPAPDNETMESLIDTNEQLQTALNQHGRAVLNARKQLGINERSNTHTPQDAVYEGGPPPSTWQNPAAAAASSSTRANHNSTPPPTIPKPLPSPPSGKGKSAAVWEPSPPTAGPSSRSANGARPDPPRKDSYGSADDEDRDPFRDPTPEPPRGSGGGWRPSGTNTAAAADQPPRLAIDSFHPGFGATTTSSYVGRQDSAVEKTQMHGGASGAGAGEVVSPVSGGTGTMSSSGFAPGARRDEEEEEDRYGATPKKDGHVFRY
jgi:hypothetical protein